MKRFLDILLLLFLALGVYSCKRKGELPPYGRFPPEALRDPLQTPTLRPPFKARIGNQIHPVVPRFDYQICGLVVSSGFGKTLARLRNDDLNLMDVGLVWGSNLDPEIYRNIAFRNDGVWLRFDSGDRNAWSRFDLDRLSNNHLICTDPSLRKRIKALHPGEIVSIEGCLADYSGRRSSTVRTDRGGGACEIVWVDRLAVLEDGTRPWALLSAVGLYGFFGLLLLKIVHFLVC